MEFEKCSVRFLRLGFLWRMWWNGPIRAGTLESDQGGIAERCSGGKMTESQRVESSEVISQLAKCIV